MNITINIIKLKNVKRSTKRAQTNTLAGYIILLNTYFILILASNLIFILETNNFNINNIYYYLVVILPYI